MRVHLISGHKNPKSIKWMSWSICLEVASRGTFPKENFPILSFKIFDLKSFNSKAYAVVGLVLGTAEEFTEFNSVDLEIAI